MKTYYLIFLLPILFACENKEAKRNAILQDSLTTANEVLTTQLDEDDSIIANREEAMAVFLYSFNEISENLKQIKQKENILSTSLAKEGYKESQKEQILKDIQFIYAQMNKNKKRLASVSSRLKNANLKIDDLEKAIVNLNDQLAEKDSDIEVLKLSLEKLNIDFSNLSMAYGDEIIQSAEKTDLLNEAYFVIGTKKELRNKKIVTEKGGFIGIGKTQKLNNELSDDDFNKIDISTFTEISLNASKKVKLITPHAESSYKLITVSEKFDKLVITDAKKFWSSSKYLVIEVEK